MRKVLIPMKELSETMSTNEVQEIHNNLVWKFDSRNYYPKSIYRSPSLAVIRDATAAYQFITGLDFKRDVPKIRKEYERICNVIQFTDIRHSIPIRPEDTPPQKSGVPHRPDNFGWYSYIEKTVQVMNEKKIENKLDFKNATMKFRFSSEYVRGKVYLYLFYLGEGSELLPVEKGNFHKLDDRFTIFGASLCNEIEAWLGKDKYMETWIQANAAEDKGDSPGFFQKLYDIFRYDRVLSSMKSIERKENYLNAIRIYASALNEKLPLLSIVKPLVDEYIYDGLDDASKKELSKWTMGICVDYKPDLSDK